MESFKWGPQFKTGIAEIDEQHKKLVGLLNDFGKALSMEELSQKILDQVVENTAEYAKVHFQTEESLMCRMGIDPRHHKNHVSNHNSFLVDILYIAESIDPEDSKGYHRLHNFLTRWLIYHILGIDQNMARQISAIENGLSPTEAFEREEIQPSGPTETLLVALCDLFSLVSDRNKALVELNQTLEARVAARTQELTQANRELEVISITDHLTQLPNRRYAMQQLHLLWEEAMEYGHPLCCMMIDADNFKEVNDVYGHDAGDLVIKSLGWELQDSIRSDDVVCRMGGDEFLAICPNTNLKGALHLAEQIRSKVSQLHVLVDNDLWHGSISVGVAVSDSTVKDLDTLLKIADNGVYEAKKNGRNCVRTTQTQDIAHNLQS